MSLVPNKIALSQDCLILLCHGPRAAYFPTPYVDEYGEKHRHFRGKPLHLDRNRCEANLNSFFILMCKKLFSHQLQRTKIVYLEHNSSQFYPFIRYYFP